MCPRASYYSCALQTSPPASVTLLAGVTYPRSSEPLGWSVLGRGWLFSIFRGAEDSYCGRPSAWRWDGGIVLSWRGHSTGWSRRRQCVSEGAWSAQGVCLKLRFPHFHHLCVFLFCVLPCSHCSFPSVSPTDCLSLCWGVGEIPHQPQGLERFSSQMHSCS